MNLNLLIGVLIISFLTGFTGYWEKYCLQNINITVYYLLRSLFGLIITCIGILIYIFIFDKNKTKTINAFNNINFFQIKLVIFTALQIFIYVVVLLYVLKITKNTTNYLILLIMGSIIFIPIINYIIHKKVISNQQIFGIILAILSVILIYY